MSAPLVTRLIAAALPFIPATHAFELCNNIACASPDCTEIEAHIAIMIRHRLAHGWIQCSDVDMCAIVMGRAWRRWHAEQGAEVAA
jgi:hypothetical protein